jgi:hypothetical protein
MCHDCSYGFIGLWFLISAFVLTSSPKINLVNHVVTGAVLAGLACWAGVGYGKWLDWTVAAIGAWLILSGFLFNSNSRYSRINSSAAGVFVILAGFWPFYV